MNEIINFLEKGEVKPEPGRIFDHIDLETFKKSAGKNVTAFISKPLGSIFDDLTPYKSENIKPIVEIIQSFRQDLANPENAELLKKMASILKERYPAKYPQITDAEQELIKSYAFKSLTLHPELKAMKNDNLRKFIEANEVLGVLNSGIAAEVKNNNNQENIDIHQAIDKPEEKAKKTLLDKFFGGDHDFLAANINIMTPASSIATRSATAYERLGSEKATKLILEEFEKKDQPTQENFLQAAEKLDRTNNNGLSDEGKNLLKNIKHKLQELNPNFIYIPDITEPSKAASQTAVSAPFTLPKPPAFFEDIKNFCKQLFDTVRDAIKSVSSSSSQAAAGKISDANNTTAASSGETELSKLEKDWDDLKQQPYNKESLSKFNSFSAKLSEFSESHKNASMQITSRIQDLRNALNGEIVSYKAEANKPPVAEAAQPDLKNSQQQKPVSGADIDLPPLPPGPK